MEQRRCFSPEKEKAIKMIERIKEKVDKCDPISVKMLDTTTYFLEDIINHGGKICVDDYIALRHQASTLATKFSNNCSCIKKKV